MSLMRAERIYEQFGETHFYMYKEQSSLKLGYCNVIRKPYKARIEIDGKNVSMRPKVYLISEHGKTQINEFFTANIFDNYDEALASYKESTSKQLDSFESELKCELDMIVKQKELLDSL